MQESDSQTKTSLDLRELNSVNPARRAMGRRETQIYDYITASEKKLMKIREILLDPELPIERRKLIQGQGYAL